MKKKPVSSPGVGKTLPPKPPPKPPGGPPPPVWVSRAPIGRMARRWRGGCLTLSPLVFHQQSPKALRCEGHIHACRRRLSDSSAKIFDALGCYRQFS